MKAIEDLVSSLKAECARVYEEAYCDGFRDAIDSMTRAAQAQMPAKLAAAATARVEAVDRPTIAAEPPDRPLPMRGVLGRVRPPDDAASSPVEEAPVAVEEPVDEEPSGNGEHLTHPRFDRAQIEWPDVTHWDQPLTKTASRILAALLSLVDHRLPAPTYPELDALAKTSGAYAYIKHTLTRRGYIRLEESGRWKRFVTPDGRATGWGKTHKNAGQRPDDDLPAGSRSLMGSAAASCLEV